MGGREGRGEIERERERENTKVGAIYFQTALVKIKSPQTIYKRAESYITNNP
jgi:hypothetical protein